MVYLLVFFASSLLCYIGLSINNKHRISKRVFLVLSVVFPCALAGLRGDYIGTDMQIYVVPTYKMAMSSDSFVEFCGIVAAKLRINDIGYLFITYLATRLPNSRFVLLASLEALVYIPIFVSLLKYNKNKNSVIFGQFIFFSFLYNASYNMVRQSIALAFATLSIFYLIHREKLRFILFVAIGALFHYSAFILLGIYLIYQLYSDKRISKSIKKAFLALILVVAAITVMNSSSLLRVLSITGILSNKLTSSLNAWSRDADFSFVNTFFYLTIYFLMYWNRKRISSLVPLEKAYRYIFALGIIVSQVGVYVAFADRIAYYFLYPIIFTVLPQIAVEKYRRGNAKAMISQWLIFCLFTIYWVWWIGILNYHDTLPYVMFTE